MASLELDDLLYQDNIAELLSEDELNTIGSDVVQGYDNDAATLSSWRSSNEEWIKLATQIRERKNYPWPDASNVKFPLLTTAAIQFQAQAYPSLIPGSSVVNGFVVGKDEDGSKTKRAVRIGKHMSYQLLYEMDDWEEDLDRMCMLLPIVGTSFKKTYYDTVRNRNRSELIPVQDLVVNYYAKSLEDATRVTQVVYYYPNEIEEFKRAGLFSDIDLTESDLQEKENEPENSVDQDIPDFDPNRPHKFLEQHTYLDLDGDGYKEPYIIVTHYDTKKVARIVARYSSKSIEWDGENVLLINPEHYFTVFQFIKDPASGVYGLGFGSLLGPINETVNTIINQLIDAGKLSNLQSGFISKTLKMKSGDQPLRPGEWRQAQITHGRMQDAIMPLPTKEPSNVLYLLLGMLIDSGKQVSSIMDIMTGKLPGQNTPATVVMAAIEHGTKVFTAIYKRMFRGLTKEYKKLFALNAEYLTEKQYFTVLDPNAQEVLDIGRGDYEEEGIDVIPSADPNVATEVQRLAKIQTLDNVMALGTINRQEYTKRYLEATNQPGIEKLMDVPPPAPDPELVMKQQEMQWKQQKEGIELQIKVAESQERMAQLRAQTLQIVANIDEVDKKSIIAEFDAYTKRLDALSGIIQAENQRMFAEKDSKEEKSSGSNKGRKGSLEEA